MGYEQDRMRRVGPQGNPLLGTSRDIPPYANDLDEDEDYLDDMEMEEGYVDSERAPPQGVDHLSQQDSYGLGLMGQGHLYSKQLKYQPLGNGHLVGVVAGLMPGLPEVPEENDTNDEQDLIKGGGREIVHEESGSSSFDEEMDLADELNERTDL